MPEHILEEDKIIEIFPLDVKPEQVRTAPAADFFQKTGIPEK
jgi:hypothetical protein